MGMVHTLFDSDICIYSGTSLISRLSWPAISHILILTITVFYTSRFITLPTRNGEKVLMNSSAGYSVRHVSPNMDEINSTGGALSSLMLTPS